MMQRASACGEGERKPVQAPRVGVQQDPLSATCVRLQTWIRQLGAADDGGDGEGHDLPQGEAGSHFGAGVQRRSMRRPVPRIFKRHVCSHATATA
jgi:hypothetical protein